MTEPPEPFSHPGKLRRLIALLPLALALGLALLIGLSFLQRLDWRLDLLAHLRLHLVIALIAMAVLQLLTKQHRRSLAIVVLAVAGLTADWITTPKGPATFAGQPDLRVIHANVSGRELEEATLDAWVRDRRPDVLLLQEVTPNTLNEVPFITSNYVVLAIEPRWDTRGVAILARHGIDASAELVHPLPDADRPLPVVQVRLADRTASFLHFSTTRPLPGDMHAYQADAFGFAADWVAAERSAGRVPVVIGDFNQTPRGWRLRDLANGGDLSVAMVRSWPGELPRLMSLAIDGLLVPNNDVAVKIAPGPLLGGDHWPIVADLRFVAPSG